MTAGTITMLLQLDRTGTHVEETFGHDYLGIPLTESYLHRLAFDLELGKTIQETSEDHGRCVSRDDQGVCYGISPQQENVDEQAKLLESIGQAQDLLDHRTIQTLTSDELPGFIQADARRFDPLKSPVQSIRRAHQYGDFLRWSIQPRQFDFELRSPQIHYNQIDRAVREILGESLADLRDKITISVSTDLPDHQPTKMEQPA